MHPVFNQQPLGNVLSVLSLKLTAKSPKRVRKASVGSTTGISFVLDRLSFNSLHPLPHSSDGRFKKAPPQKIDEQKMLIRDKYRVVLHDKLTLDKVCSALLSPVRFLLLRHPSNALMLKQHL